MLVTNVVKKVMIAFFAELKEILVIMEKISSYKKVKYSVKWCFGNIGRIQENFARRKIISKRKHV